VLPVPPDVLVPQVPLDREVLLVLRVQMVMMGPLGRLDLQDLLGREVVVALKVPLVLPALMVMTVLLLP